MNELLEKGPNFRVVKIISGMSGESLGEFQDKYDAIDEYGDFDVFEWNTYADSPGYAIDYILITVQD